MGKYAVVVGINYVKDPSAALKGCCNDAREIKKILKTKGFDDSNVKMLIDDDSDFPDPSGANVKKYLNWLCSDRSAEDTIFFHFSGHGTQIPSDGDDNESDGKDEAIVLEGMFLMADDDLKQFFSMLPKGSSATIIMDCCHSGSMLDGTQVAIDGAKDNNSITSNPESLSLLGLLGGIRDLNTITEPRSLSVNTIASILGGRLGHPVSPNSSGIGGALAETFGGDAGKLMVKFALSQLAGGNQSGNSALAALISASMSGNNGNGTSNSNTGNSGLKIMLMTLFKSCLSSPNNQNPLPNSFSTPEVPSSTQNQNPLQSLLSGGNPMGSLHSMLGSMGLQGQNALPDDVPHYKPPTSSTKDVAILITGCQAHETSADVRPPGQQAFGALTKTLSDVYFQNTSISHYDLVSQIRKDMSKSKFKQNPCLECDDVQAGKTFICD